MLCLGCTTTMFIIVLSHQLLTVAPYVCGSIGYIYEGSYWSAILGVLRPGGLLLSLVERDMKHLI